MRRRHLESVSSRSLSVRGSWGTVPSVFWYGAPGGTRGPLGKGGAAERWRVTPSVSGVTRHGAQPATTRTHKRNAPAASRTGFAPCKINAPPLGDHNLGLIFLLPTFLHRKAGPRRRAVLTKPCKRLRPAARCPPTRPKIPLPAFISFAPGMHGSRKNRPTVFPLLRGRAPEFAGIRAEHLSDHGKSGKSPAVSGERFCWTGPVRPL